MKTTSSITKGGLFGAALAVAVALGCAHQSPRSSSENGECRRVKLDPKPRWMFFGYWDRGGTEIVLTDTINGRLLRYSRDGAFLGSVASPGNGPLEYDRPLKIVDGGDERFLVNRIDRVLALDEDLQPAWGVELPKLDLPGSERVTFMSPDVALGRRLVGVMRIQEGKDSTWWGLGALSLGDSPRVERIQPLPEGTRGRDRYTPGPVVARAGEGIYALRFEEKPHIQRLLPEKGRLTAFPAGYEQGYELPPSAGPATTEIRFLTMEMATASVSLFGRGPYLYLLTRKPLGEGKTNWTLHQIDPERDVILREIRLPTEASHIVVVPGPIDWAIVEKGRVGPSAEQDIGTVVLLSSTWVESPRSSSAVLECAPGDS